MSLLILREDGDVWVFDLLRETTESISAMVTEHPIETSSSATDHVQRLPDRFAVRVGINPNPAPSAIGPTGPERVTRGRDFLEGCLGQFCDLVFPDERIPIASDLLLEEIPLPYAQGGLVEFTLRWKRPGRVVARSTVLPARVAPRAIDAVQDINAQQQALRNLQAAQASRAIAEQTGQRSAQQVPRSIAASAADQVQ